MILNAASCSNSLHTSGQRSPPSSVTLYRSIARTSLFGAVAFAALCAAPSARAQESEAEVGEEEIIVTTTRSGRRVQDEPIRVEVIGREEIEEKLLMTPGNIATLVNETGGVRVQITSPALGAANIRMQGMSGRYTSLLADGLPLY